MSGKVRTNPPPLRLRQNPRGLHRQALIGVSPAKTVKNLFSDLRRLRSGEFIGEDVERHLQGARFIVDRAEGHGSCDLYRLDEDLYVVATDSTYDSPRFEVVPGEGLVELHLRLSGMLDMTLPGRSEPFEVAGPCLLLLYQPVSVDACERVQANRRDVSVSLFCKPEYLAALLRRNSIACWPILDDIAQHDAKKTIWFQTRPLSAGLLYVAKHLLNNRYRHGIRLLYAEAKSLELICEVLSITSGAEAEPARGLSDTVIRQLEAARQLLVNRLSNPLTIGAIAKTVGMSPSNLKQLFKARYGATLFEFGLDCRMRHALYLLRAHQLSVDQVAHEAGYRHQTSFSYAFRDHFGFLPRMAKSVGVMIPKAAQ